MTVTLYTQPGCAQCHATARYLQKHEIDYLPVDITKDESSRALVERLGYSSLPVVVAGSQHWSGFRPDRIAALKQEP